MRPLSVVLPCYNEEERIARTVRDVAQWMTRRGIPGEIIVVDDGSIDRSADIVRGLRETIPGLTLIVHGRNQGYGPTVRDGLDAARCDCAAFMDSDGQFAPESFDLLLPHLRSYPFVSGQRTNRADPPLRRLYGKFLEWINAGCFRICVPDVNCALKVFDRSLWPRIRSEEPFDKFFNTAIFVRLQALGIPWTVVPVPHYARTSGAARGASWPVIVRMFGEMRMLRRLRARPEGRESRVST